MISENQIDSAIKRLFEEISFPTAPQGLYEPLKYMLQIGGKRLRPRLCLLCYSLFQDSLGEDTLTAAAALEIFHSFTLMHDDILDHSDLRRGVETVWKHWDEQTAILSGDVMLIDSYQRLSKSAPRELLTDVMSLFSQTAREVCEGQQLDLNFEDREENVSMAEYEEMIRLKTAVLLACSAKMGALLGRAPKEQCDALYHYALELGMAFQIADDYLDTFGDQKVFGKPIGGDILNNKKTWLLVKTQQKIGSQPELQALLSEALNSEPTDQKAKDQKISVVRSIYEALGVHMDAQAEIKRYTSLAIKTASEGGIGGVKLEQLKRFAEKLVGRVA